MSDYLFLRSLHRVYLFLPLPVPNPLLLFMPIINLYTGCNGPLLTSDTLRKRRTEADATGTSFMVAFSPPKH